MSGSISRKPSISNTGLLEEAKLQRQPKPKSLAGRVALVTGGAGGIGKAIAARLIGEGACVVLADIDGQSLDTAVADFAKRFGKDLVSGVRVDVTSEAEVGAAFEEALLAFGGVDIVVANAGIASAAAFEDTSLELWNRNIAILATGYFLSARAGYRIMKDQGLGGSIVFIASKNALAASPGASAYCAAKAAEVHLARCLALEGAPFGIRANTVNPDAVLARLEDLAGRVAGAAGGFEQGERRRTRRGLPPAVAAQAVRLSRGHRRGGLLFRLRPLGQEHRQYPQRRRRQRGELRPLTRGETAGQLLPHLLTRSGHAPRRERRRGIFAEGARAAPRANGAAPGIRRTVYSAGVADTTSAGIVTGSTSRRKRRHAMRISRNSLTQAFGALKCDANSRFCSIGVQ